MHAFDLNHYLLAKASTVILLMCSRVIWKGCKGWWNGILENDETRREMQLGNAEFIKKVSEIERGHLIINSTYNEAIIYEGSGDDAIMYTTLVLPYRFVNFKQQLSGVVAHKNNPDFIVSDG